MIFFQWNQNQHLEEARSFKCYGTVGHLRQLVAAWHPLSERYFDSNSILANYIVLGCKVIMSDLKTSKGNVVYWSLDKFILKCYPFKGT